MSQRTRTLIRAAPRPRPRALLAALCAGAAVALAACGDNLSPSAVARVGDEPIEKSEFDRWMATAVSSQQAALAPGGATADAAVPVPPDFTECIDAKQEQASALEEQAQGQAPEPPSEAQLKEQCEQEYELIKQQVMQFLTQAEAIEQEAEERGLSVSEEEVTTQLEDLKEQSFRNDEQYQQFLENAGMTEDDLRFRIRIDLLIAEIRQDVLEGAGDVSDEEVEAYYEENKDRPPIGEPEQRDVRVVVTETEEQANEARQALEDGDSFASVAREFSIDPASKNRGGRLTVQQGAEEEAFDEAVFAAEEGELTGPVETELGFYVFEVTDIQPAKTQSLEESREAIVEVVSAREEEEALTEFQEEFDEEAREKTVCAEEFVIVGCKNGPDPEEAPEPGAPVAPPEQVPPEGAPPPPAPPGGGQGGGRGGSR